MVSLGFSIYSVMPSAHSDSFTSFFPFCMPFMSFPPPIATVLCNPGMQAHQSTRAKRLRGVSWTSAIKTGHQRYVWFPSQRQCSLGAWWRVSVNVVPILPRVSGKDYNRPLDVCLIRSLSLRPQLGWLGNRPPQKDRAPGFVASCSALEVVRV